MLIVSNAFLISSATVRSAGLFCFKSDVMVLCSAVFVEWLLWNPCLFQFLAITERCVCMMCMSFLILVLV